MKLHQAFATGFGIVIFLNTVNVSAEEHAKKLIEYGWDLPYPDFVKDHIQEMEKRPFNGLMFRLKEINHLFDTRTWKNQIISKQADDLRAIKWSKFTDNFLCMYAADRWGMSWFNDEHWEVIKDHVRQVAKIARDGGLVGLCFDPEPYGENPWAYRQSAGYAFSYVATKVRERGKQVMQAIQSEMPSAKILTLYNLSLYHRLANINDSKKREDALKRYPWPLLPAFINGLIDGAASDTTIIDGYEQSYTFYEKKQYLDAKKIIRGKAPLLLDEASQIKYRARVEAGMAVYVDHIMGMRPSPEKFPSYYMKPADKLKWLEHNIYYSLKSSDEYVWVYSEHMDWWRHNVPNGVEEAVRAAKTKIQKSQQLAFDIENKVDSARNLLKLKSLITVPR